MDKLSDKVGWYHVIPPSQRLPLIDALNTLEVRRIAMATPFVSDVNAVMHCEGQKTNGAQFVDRWYR